MKLGKWLSVVVAFAVSGTFLTGVTVENKAVNISAIDNVYQNAVLGDLNSDGKIDVFDSCMFKKARLSGFKSNYVRRAADVDGNLKAEIIDIGLINKFVLSVDNKFPSDSVRDYDIYYAIDAEYTNAIWENTNAGFSGEAYVNPDNSAESSIEWTVNADVEGNYRITFRYANGSTEDRPTEISVNGVKVLSGLEFSRGTGWTEWKEVSIVVTLQAGENKIKAAGITSYGGANMDFLKLEEAFDEEITKDDYIDPSARQVEDLNRGLSAANTGSGMLVSWRALGTDKEGTSFKLYKNGSLIYDCSADAATNYFDKGGTASDKYTLDTFVGSSNIEKNVGATIFSNKNSGQSGAYFDIPLQKPAGGKTPDGKTYTYSANDASVADLDGDGEYEIILKWDPSNSQDNSKSGYTGNVYLDAYKMNGTRLWRIDLGINIRAGAHYTQFMVYDFDGNGYAELVCKTADGTVDGKGNVIGQAGKDYRNLSGYILSGPEYLTLFDGRTGAAVDTINYEPGRGNVSDWGDSYGNRVDRYLAGVAYLDGKTPSLITARGYYTRTAIVAYDVKDNKLVKRWIFDTGFDSSNPYYGQGNHSLAVADLDSDGFDEIVYGSCAIDNDGKGLHSTGLGHGDMLQVGDMDPSRPGMEIYMVHEEAEANYGASLRDAKTGEIIFKISGSSDTGRGLGANFRSDIPGMEFTSTADSLMYDASGNKIGAWSDITKWGMNSIVWWTGTLERAALDRTMVDQYGLGRVFTGDGVTYNNGSKSNASVTADLFGDWREELVFPTSDSSALRVFTTTYTTEYKITTLMHDTQYRCGVAIENVGYNQAPNTSFFLGTGYDLPEKPNVYAAKVN